MASYAQLTDQHHNELNILDNDLTRILVRADQKCVKFGAQPWSLQLHETYLIHHYWTLKLSHRRTGRNYPQAFQQIESRIPKEKLYKPNIHTISAHLREAQNQLKKIHKEAKEKCRDHLNELIAAATICKDQKKKKLILCLKRAEELRSCYAMVRSITKPKQQGGISHVRIPVLNPPKKPTWESIYEPQRLEQHVLKQHRSHFSQADGTVFTQEPLRTLINDECTSDYAKQILAGTANIDDLPVNQYTKDLLTHLRTKVPQSKPTRQPLKTDAIIQGFKTWPECTSTSPSGRHLGIYKSLAKHFPPPKKTNPTNIPPEPADPLQSGNNVLKLIIMMMELAITHTHTYDQWKTIWTLLLEKDPGNPQID